MDVGKRETAFFVRTPRTIRDLWRLHMPEMERTFEIAKIIELSAIDYENFTEDMLADREFIENNARLCKEGVTLRCLLIKQRGKSGGVLVIPELDAYVKWAAYISWEADG